MSGRPIGENRSEHGGSRLSEGSSASPPGQPATEGSRADALFGPSLDLVEPLVRLLVANGIGYQDFGKALKPLFVAAARAEIVAEGREPNDAALSLRSGVQRKDTRAFRTEAGSDDASTAEPRRELSVAEIVFTRWTTDPAYRGPDGGPAELPVGGPAPSFDALVQAVTRDLSRRTVLNELSGLGLVAEASGRVTPLARSMTPRQGFTEIARYMADHVRDHLLAGAANVAAVGRGETAPFLEHSLYGKGLSAESLAQLQVLARRLWQDAQAEFAEQARLAYERDRAAPPPGENRHPGRLRFGVYFFADPDGSSSS